MIEAVDNDSLLLPDQFDFDEVSFDTIQPITFDDDPDNELKPLSEAEIGIRFDELTEIAANQPDDELAFKGLSRIVSEIYERGQIDMAMQMAMTLGAMACMDPHFESLASEAASAVDSLHGKDDGHGHKDDKEAGSHHNSKTCKTCLAGKACLKK